MDIPGRVLLDTNIVNFILDWGEAIHDGGDIPAHVSGRDAEDILALRDIWLADGETPKRFAIEWGGSFRIVGDAMIFTDNQGSSRTIFGYPTREVGNAIRKAGV